MLFIQKHALAVAKKKVERKTLYTTKYSLKCLNACEITINLRRVIKTARFQCI